MNEGLIPRRYAKALYLVAKEKGTDSRIYEIMQNLAASFHANPELQSVMSNPFIADADKTSLLVTAAGADSGTDTAYADFLKLLVDNRRISIIRLIALAYIQIFRDANHIHQVNVVSAAPMSSADEERLRSLIEKHLHGASIEYTHTVDPDLIGGFTVNVGNERIDASVRNELKQLRLSLTSK